MTLLEQTNGSSILSSILLYSGFPDVMEAKTIPFLLPAFVFQGLQAQNMEFLFKQPLMDQSTMILSGFKVVVAITTFYDSGFHKPIILWVNKIFCVSWLYCQSSWLAIAGSVVRKEAKIVLFFPCFPLALKELKSVSVLNYPHPGILWTKSSQFPSSQSPVCESDARGGILPSY